tara:strand:- start:5 stop:259 length:255 start_codon:yes stop_codon:yes gene_type:complete
MGGIFGKTPKPPAPDPAIAESQKRQEDILKKQEIRTSEKEKSANDKIQARKRAMRKGGQRILLSSTRENAQTGIDDGLKTTLGA